MNASETKVDSVIETRFYR